MGSRGVGLSGMQRPPQGSPNARIKEKSNWHPLPVSLLQPKNRSQSLCSILMIGEPCGSLRCRLPPPHRSPVQQQVRQPQPLSPQAVTQSWGLRCCLPPSPAPERQSRRGFQAGELQPPQFENLCCKDLREHLAKLVLMGSKTTAPTILRILRCCHLAVRPSARTLDE